MYNPSICLSLKDLRPSLWLCFYSEVGFFQPGNYFYPALFLLHPSRAHPLPVGPFSFFLPVLSQISRKVIPFYAPYDPRWTTIRLQIIEYFDCQANKSRGGEEIFEGMSISTALYPDLLIFKHSQSVFAWAFAHHANR